MALQPQTQSTFLIFVFSILIVAVIHLFFIHLKVETEETEGLGLAQKHQNLRGNLLQSLDENKEKETKPTERLETKPSRVRNKKRISKEVIDEYADSTADKETMPPKKPIIKETQPAKRPVGKETQPAKRPVGKETQPPKRPPPLPPTEKPPLLTTRQMSQADEVMNLEEEVPSSEERLKKMLYWKQGQEKERRRELWKEDPIKKLWKPESTEKYLAFDTWKGGFNNERMSLELAFVYALMTNRTFVLPPPFHLYLLKWGFLEDFFDLEDMKKAHRVITWKEFAARFPGKVTETSFEGVKNIGTNLQWTSTMISQSVFCFPKIPTEARDVERLERFAAGRKETHEVTEEMSKHQVVYIPDRVLLGSWYLYYFFTDVEVERRVKFIFKNYVHYKEKLFRIAHRIVMKLPNPVFSSFHLRRGDFQYSEMKNLEADVIFNNIQRLFKPKELIYVTTDERDAKIKTSYFLPWNKTSHQVLSLSDFQQELGDLESQYYGLVEQIICTQARVFAGTWLSTFSGFITRMRGYMQRKNVDTFFTSLKFPEHYKKGFPAPPWNRPFLGLCVWCREFSSGFEEWEKARDDLWANQKV